MQESQESEESEREEPAADEYQHGERTHAVVPQPQRSGEEKAGPPVAEAASADKRQERRRRGENQTGDAESKSRVGPNSRASRQNRVAARTTSGFSGVEVDRPVLLSTQLTCKA